MFYIYISTNISIISGCGLFWIMCGSLQIFVLNGVLDSLVVLIVGLLKNICILSSNKITWNRNNEDK